MRKPWQILLLLCVSLVSSNCSQIPIKDVTLYWPIGVDGALVTHTLSDETNKISRADWETLEVKTVAMLYAVIVNPG